MKEFIYNEADYIHPIDLKIFKELLEKYDYNFGGIQDKKEFERVLTFLLSLTERAPSFIQAYELASEMINELEENQENESLKNCLENDWFKSCLNLVNKENLFSRPLAWEWIENRPLIRGIYLGAQKKWMDNKFLEANELFAELFKSNTVDNIGARYAAKATAEKMMFDEFCMRFIFEDQYGSHFNSDLADWYKSI